MVCIDLLLELRFVVSVYLFLEYLILWVVCLCVDLLAVFVYWFICCFDVALCVDSFGLLWCLCITVYFSFVADLLIAYWERSLFTSTCFWVIDCCAWFLRWLFVDFYC